MQMHHRYQHLFFRARHFGETATVCGIGRVLSSSLILRSYALWGPSQSLAQKLRSIIFLADAGGRVFSPGHGQVKARPARRPRLARKYRRALRALIEQHHVTRR